MLQFGTPAEGRAHTDRPAAFGIAEMNGKIALVRIDADNGDVWWDLPGGALEDGEDEVAAMIREFGEEAGLRVRAGNRVAELAQYFLKSDGQAVNNRGGVYDVTIEAEAPELKIEADHTLVWLDPAAAIRMLRHDGHAYAVTCWLRARA